jgi:hypothetical protein
MYARVTQLEIDTLRATTDEALDAFKETVLPQLREQDAFDGVCVLCNPDGRGLILSFWATQDAAAAHSETGFYADVLANHMTLFTSPPGRERYEVLYADVPAPVP